MALSNKDRRLRIKMRVRKDISGTAERPRMSVFRSQISTLPFKLLMMLQEELYCQLRH
jgi:hypothetical protein